MDKYLHIRLRRKTTLILIGIIVAVYIIDKLPLIARGFSDGYLGR